MDDVGDLTRAPQRARGSCDQLSGSSSVVHRVCSGRLKQRKPCAPWITLMARAAIALAPALQARANEILSLGSRLPPRVNSPILRVARSRRPGHDSNLHRTTYRSPPYGSAQAAQKGQFILPGVGPSKTKISTNRCITITPKREGHCDTHARLRAQGLGRFGVLRPH
jgi:hypothetical protein